MLVLVGNNKLCKTAALNSKTERGYKDRALISYVVWPNSPKSEQLSFIQQEARHKLLKMSVSKSVFEHPSVSTPAYNQFKQPEPADYTIKVLDERLRRIES